MINKINNSSLTSLLLGLTGDCSPFINLVFHIFNHGSLLYYRWRKISVEFCASPRLLLFYICLRSLLINTHVVFISFFVSVPLRRGCRGSRISVFDCSFVPVSFCIFDYLYWDFWFFVDCFVTYVCLCVFFLKSLCCDRGSSFSFSMSICWSATYFR